MSISIPHNRSELDRLKLSSDPGERRFYQIILTKLIESGDAFLAEFPEHSSPQYLANLERLRKELTEYELFPKTYKENGLD